MEEIKIKLGKDNYQKILAHCKQRLPKELSQNNLRYFLSFSPTAPIKN